MDSSYVYSQIVDDTENNYGFATDLRVKIFREQLQEYIDSPDHVFFECGPYLIIYNKSCLTEMFYDKNDGYCVTNVIVALIVHKYNNDPYNDNLHNDYSIKQTYSLRMEDYVHINNMNIRIGDFCDCINHVYTSIDPILFVKTHNLPNKYTGPQLINNHQSYEYRMYDEGKCCGFVIKFKNYQIKKEKCMNNCCHFIHEFDKMSVC